MVVNGTHRRDARIPARCEIRFTRSPRFRNLLRRRHVAQHAMHRWFGKAARRTHIKNGLALQSVMAILLRLSSF